MGKDIKKVFEIKTDINNAIAKWNEHIALVDEAMVGVESLTENVHGEKIDARILREIIAIYQFDGETREEKIAKYKATYQDMYQAFYEKSNKREKYIKDFYTKLERVHNLYENGINSEDDFIDFNVVRDNNQNFLVFAKENKDIVDRMYSTLEEKAHFNDTFMKGWKTALMKTATIKDEHPEYHTKYSSNIALAKEQGMDVASDISISWYEAKEKGTNVLDINMDGYIELEDEYNSIKDAYNEQQRRLARNEEVEEDVIEEEQVEEANDKMVDRCNNLVSQVVNFVDLKETINAELKLGDKVSAYNEGLSQIYRDGKPLLEEAKKYFNEHYNLENELAARTRPGQTLTDEAKERIKNSMYKEVGKMLIANDLKTGDHVISVCHPKFVNGQREFEVKHIKPDVSQLEQRELSKYHWIRTTFFNWGPFKIKPSVSHTNDLYKNANKLEDGIKIHQTVAYNQLVEGYREKYLSNQMENELDNSKEISEKNLNEMLKIDTSEKVNEDQKEFVKEEANEKVANNDINIE